MNGRTMTMVALLAGLGLASAQGQARPDAATCAAVIAPQARAMSPQLTQAVTATLTAYDAQGQALLNVAMTRRLGAADLNALTAYQKDVGAYLKRLLPVTGWPGDPGVRAVLWNILPDPVTQLCAGQLALNAATTPGERAQAVSIIDRGLVGLGFPQRYGSVFGTTDPVTPLPIEEPEGVDARRAALGLLPLAEEVKRMQAARVARLPRATPPGLKRPVVLHDVCRAFTTSEALNRPLTSGQVESLAQGAARLVQADQESRTGQAGARSMADVDRESTVWLKEVLRQRGWPSANRADVQLAVDAWLLAQHADARPAVQACILDLMEQQVSTAAEGQNLAYLTDRVRLANGEPQVYGTQVAYDDAQGKASPRFLDDPAHVNARRAKVGLEPIEEYLKSFERPRP